MDAMERRRWTRDEQLKVLALYCQLPFGKMHSRNPAVAALAPLIDRTPSAVAYKLANFASLDPDLRARGIGGMGNVSQADRAIWDEFFGRWETLADAFVVEANEKADPRTQTSRGDASPPSGPTQITREAQMRRGQSFFRSAVLALHDGKCCITGITTPQLLRASHIVPWSQDALLRLEPRNGLCLNALHDAAFDCGLITLTDDYRLQISSRLRDEVSNPVYTEMFARRAGMTITLPERLAPTPEILAFHRRNVFCA